ncbi:MAG: TetR/AcrR family transcriptional regulator [Acidobacteria bacterium]|nr:TetR/AcrR family transcriptional regulator [Acidobacteriota bacterium]
MSAPDRRTAILKTAISLFAANGFRGTTTRQIAAAVGVTEPVLYEHFATKGDLYHAIIDAKSQAGIEYIREMLSPFIEREDDRGFFRKLGQVIVEFYERDPAYIRLLMFSALEGHELADLFYQRQTRIYLEFVLGYIQRRIKAGEFRKMNAEVVARSFAGMISSYAQARVLFPNCVMDIDPRKAVDGMVAIFLEGLLTPQD